MEIRQTWAPVSLLRFLRNASIHLPHAGHGRDRAGPRNGRTFWSSAFPDDRPATHGPDRPENAGPGIATSPFLNVPHGTFVSFLQASPVGPQITVSLRQNSR